MSQPARIDAFTSLPMKTDVLSSCFIHAAFLVSVLTMLLLAGLIFTACLFAC